MPCSTPRSSAGLAILVIATDFEEVANICHRALVFSRGRVVDELDCDAAVRGGDPACRLGRHRRIGRAAGRARMSSIRSTALEPTRAELREASLGQRIARLVPVYGLVILTVLLILLFSLLLPETFPTLLNLRSILSDKSLIALLSLAAMIPMMTGKIDLTVGYGIVLWHILAITLQIHAGLPWPVAVVLVILAGAAFGWFNGFLVEVARIDSFIATLGTGTVIYAVALWYTGGRQMIGNLPPSLLPGEQRQHVSACRSPPSMCCVIALLLWIVTEYLPIGRYLYAIGANPRAAELNGIPTRRYVIGAFMASGAITAVAGVVLAARLRIGQASVGLDFLLPALVGAFLGSTTIKPGRVNVWGTIVGRDHPGGRHLGHPAVRRRVLGRAHVQRRHPADRHRASPAGPAGAAAARSSGCSRRHSTTERPAGRQLQGELNDATDLRPADEQSAGARASARPPAGPMPSSTRPRPR